MHGLNRRDQDAQRNEAGWSEELIRQRGEIV